MSKDEAFERRNKDLFNKHLKEVRQDRDKRDRDSKEEIGQMAKSAGTWIHHRARGRKIIGMGKFG